MLSGSIVRCLSPSFVMSSFPSVNRNTASGKDLLHAVHRELLPVHVFHIEKKHKLARTLRCLRDTVQREDT